MALHPVLRDHILAAEVALVRERLGRAGVVARHSHGAVLVAAPELGRDRVLVLDARGYDSAPVGVGFVDARGRPLPGRRWPTGLYRGEHPVLRRPFACVRGTEDYHAHPLHRHDPWDAHRGQLRLADVVAHLLRRCRQ